jgi:hypothetical protein
MGSLRLPRVFPTYIKIVQSVQTRRRVLTLCYLPGSKPVYNHLLFSTIHVCWTMTPGLILLGNIRKVGMPGRGTRPNLATSPDPYFKNQQQWQQLGLFSGRDGPLWIPRVYCQSPRWAIASPPYLGSFRSFTVIFFVAVGGGCLATLWWQQNTNQLSRRERLSCLMRPITKWQDSQSPFAHNKINTQWSKHSYLQLLTKCIQVIIRYYMW